MQFEWWRKREKENRQSGSFEIRHRTRGGPVRSLHFCFGMVLSGADGGLFREFRPASRNNLHFYFPIDGKRRNWNWEFELLEFFCLASSSSRSGYGYFSSTLCTLRRSIDHASRYLFFFVFPSAVSSSICPFIRHFIIVSSLSFFFLDLRSNPFFVVSWFFFPFDPRFHFRSREKRKTRWNVILFADIWRRQFFGRRGQTGYELQSRTSTRPTFHV